MCSRRRSVDRGIVAKSSSRTSICFNDMSDEERNDRVHRSPRHRQTTITFVIPRYGWLQSDPNWRIPFHLECIANGEVERIVWRLDVFAEESSFHVKRTHVLNGEECRRCVLDSHHVLRKEWRVSSTTDRFVCEHCSSDPFLSSVSSTVVMIVPTHLTKPVGKSCFRTTLLRFCSLFSTRIVC